MLANIEMSKLRKTKTNTNQAVKISICCWRCSKRFQSNCCHSPHSIGSHQQLVIVCSVRCLFSRFLNSELAATKLLAYYNPHILISFRLRSSRSIYDLIVLICFACLHCDISTRQFSRINYQFDRCFTFFFCNYCKN